MRRIITFAILLSLCLTACRSSQVRTAGDFDFPSPVDTRSKPIDNQIKKAYKLETLGLTLDNLFDGARLNNARLENDSTIAIDILPENKPINPSPWYAFHIIADEDKIVYFHLHYDGFMHRYSPKVSIDFSSWSDLNTTMRYNSDSTEVTFPVSVKQGEQWIAAQEIVNSGHVDQWAKEISNSSDIIYRKFGQSTLGKKLIMLDVRHGSKAKKPIVVIFSRQHPPEVTGYFALQSFVERIARNDELAVAFRRKFRMLVFPLLNPDGVDQGHWRHNAGGIDLNRDWAYYRQRETRTVADKVVSLVQAAEAQVVMGLDFHSTWFDVYYTNLDTAGVEKPELKEQWLSYIEHHLPDYKINERPSRIGQPVTKGWFYTQFKAIGVTYEIGDDTPRDFIRQKGVVSAEGLMKLLLGRSSE